MADDDLAEQLPLTARAADAANARTITDRFARWDDIEVHHKGVGNRSPGHGVIAADGVNSRVPDRYVDHFGVDIQVRPNTFGRLGTTKVFDAFAFAFQKTEAGWIWAHAYRFAPGSGPGQAGLSTFIVECPAATRRGLGFDRMSRPRGSPAARRSSPSNSTAIR